MATRSFDGLQGLLESIGVEETIPSFPLADILQSPMDIYLSFLANALVQLTGCDPLHAWDAIQWPNDFGDFVVVIPRLRLKDINNEDLASELQATVCTIGASYAST